MKITKEWLKEQEVCIEGFDWFNNQGEVDSIKIIRKLIAEKKFDYANWLIVRIMKYEQYVAYAIYAAELVIDIYEKKYKNDNSPRLAIEAAKLCLTNNTEENRQKRTRRIFYGRPTA